MKTVEFESVRFEKINAFTFIGDPGCDGLGVEIMSVFNAALRGSSGDFVLIGGDIVPNGTKRFYKSVVEMTDKAGEKPAFMLAGNHDTDDYEAFFGRRNYYIHDDNLTGAVMDNSKRAFSDDALAILEKALLLGTEKLVLACHIPPPNGVTSNSIPPDEWGKVRRLIEPHKERVKYILCGHVHSYFEDIVDGVRLVASGGGGARIEDVERLEKPLNHYVEFFFDSSGALNHRKEDITLGGVKLDPHVEKLLSDAYACECAAHIRYKLYAERAEAEGKTGLAKLFAAASDAEFFHARNHFYAMNGYTGLDKALESSVEGENYEVTEFYKNAAEAARSAGDGLAAYSFDDAREAESVHLRLFTEALASGGEVKDREYHTCTSCGFTIAGALPKFCPVCGAPLDKIKAV